jgi:hypothetical protein
VFVTNHVLSGVLIGRALEGRPVAAFVAGVGSHLVLDSVPHWSCDKTEDGYHQRFLLAAKRDGVLGLATMAAAAIAVDRRARLSTVAAMAGAVFLDLDKPLLHFIGVNPFPWPVRRLHSWVQNESPQGMRNEVVFGVVAAAADGAVIRARRFRRLRSPERAGWTASPAAVLGCRTRRVTTGVLPAPAPNREQFEKFPNFCSSSRDGRPIAGVATSASGRRHRPTPPRVADCPAGVWGAKSPGPRPTQPALSCPCTDLRSCSNTPRGGMATECDPTKTRLPT